MAGKIIIDTDIGDDIDDAFALALALAIPQAELVGVTTVFRNTAARAQLVQKLLRTAGRDVPVYAGERFPVREPFHPFEREGETPPERSLPCQWEESYDGEVRDGAVGFLAEAAERYGSDLTVIAIGPLTNLARAIERDPRRMKKTGKIVCMGGSFNEYLEEWNVMCDPEAAQTVYGSGISFDAVGLDVTMKCPMEKDLLEKFRRSGTPMNELLTLWLDRWFGFFGFEKSVMHDPLAVAACFYDVCTFEKRHVRADLEGKRGALLVSDCARAGYSPVNVATGVDCGKFYRIVEDLLLKN
ncbi:MAG: nucleoside hydrolase [Candidatus Gallimonas sp.]